MSFDLRGYGYSRPGNRFESPNYYATDSEDAHALMEALHFPTYSVLGWCNGGTAALLLAAMHPESVRNLVIWGARAYLTKEDTDRFEVFKDVSKWSQFYKIPLLKIYGESGLKEIASKCVDALNAIRCKTKGDICKNELSKIVCPTLIFHGAKDTLVSSHHPDYLQEHVTGSRLEVIQDGRHGIHLSHHQVFNEMIEEFLNKEEQRGT